MPADALSCALETRSVSVAVPTTAVSCDSGATSVESVPVCAILDGRYVT